jgi:hypothetical protein
MLVVQRPEQFGVIPAAARAASLEGVHVAVVVGHAYLRSCSAPVIPARPGRRAPACLPSDSTAYRRLPMDTLNGGQKFDPDRGRRSVVPTPPP